MPLLEGADALDEKAGPICAADDGASRPPPTDEPDGIGCSAEPDDSENGADANVDTGSDDDAATPDAAPEPPPDADPDPDPEPLPPEPVEPIAADAAADAACAEPTAPIADDE